MTKALELAAAHGFGKSCESEDGELLHVLAARRGLPFVDANDAKDDVEATIDLLAPGGTAVLDDFWHDPTHPDPRRDAWLRHPRLTTIELWVTQRRRALVAVRR